MNITELVREAGIYDGREGLMWCSKEQLERFAALVRAEALEEAAKVCRTAQAKGLQSIREAIEAAIRELK